MFIYDYLITLGMEIDLVWFSKWSIVKVLFLFQRYSPFFDSFFLWLIRKLFKDCFFFLIFLTELIIFVLEIGQHETHSGQVCSNITYALSCRSSTSIEDEANADIRKSLVLLESLHLKVRFSYRP